MYFQHGTKLLFNHPELFREILFCAKIVEESSTERKENNDDDGDNADQEWLHVVEKVSCCVI